MRRLRTSCIADREGNANSKHKKASDPSTSGLHIILILKLVNLVKYKFFAMSTQRPSYYDAVLLVSEAPQIFLITYWKLFILENIPSCNGIIEDNHR